LSTLHYRKEVFQTTWKFTDKDLSKSFRKIVRQCLDVYPSRRPTAEYVLREMGATDADIEDLKIRRKYSRAVSDILVTFDDT
jgi:hypothetical protein